jgi:membrane protein YdbS with pleckstrin-like domain
MPLSNDQQTPSPRRPADSPAVDSATPATSVVDGREHRLDPRSIRADQLSGGILAAFLCAAMLVGVVVAGVFGSSGLSGALLLLGAWLVAGVLVTALLVSWPVLSYRYTAYEVSEQGIRIRRGVLWRTVSTVPRSRVQHTDVSQGPIERMFELATLVVYTAGTHHASVSLGGLARETALLIRDHLITGGEDDAV